MVEKDQEDIDSETADRVSHQV